MLAYTVQFSIIAGFTNFENILVDCTVLKAANNKFNVIHEDDAKTLLAYYLGHRVSQKELKHLRYPAARFRSRGDLSNLKKINILKDILRKFKETGKNTILINDMEAIHLKDKSGNTTVGYNVQTAVDSMSKMFIYIMLSDKATDHYQFPDIIEKAMDNMGEMPDTTCVDAGYNTRRVLEYIEEMRLNVLMDNNRSAKLRNGHKNEDKYHKDNMDYDYEEDFFLCYNKKRLIYQGTKVKWDKKRQDYVIERNYYNKEACYNCPYAEECCSGKYRKVKVNGGILALEMDKKMQDYENILKYLSRFSTVEAPNGTLKIHFHINEILSTGMYNIQNRLNICAGAYNLIRIYNILMGKEDIDGDNILIVAKSFCESTNVIMPILRNNKFSFKDEVLALPYICESIIEKELMNMVESNDGTIQTSLIEACD